MKHIALIACALVATLVPTAAFANDKKKDRERFEQNLAQILADRRAIYETDACRPVPQCYPTADNCSPRYERYSRHDHDRDHGYRRGGW